MSGTHAFYNGVLMRDCELKQFNEVILRDDSQTDVTYSRFRIAVESTVISLHTVSGAPVTSAGGLSAHTSTVALPIVDGETVVDRWQEIQKRLEEPRKDFWFAVNAATNQGLGHQSDGPDIPSNKPDDQESYRVVLAATGIPANQAFGPNTLNGNKPFDQDTIPEGYILAFESVSASQAATYTRILRKDVIDCDNGPKPQNVEVTRIMGGRALRVSIVFEICRVMTRPVDSEPAPAFDASKCKAIISNRWSVAETLDERWHTAHQIDGTLAVSDARYKPQAMRLLVTPRLFPFAQLTHRKFTTDKTGLRLEYSFTMKEKGPAPPPGVVDFTGRYTEKATGGMLNGSLSITVNGTPNPPSGMSQQNYKAKLLQAAYWIAKSRIRFAHKWQKLPGSDPANIVLTTSVVVEHIEENALELQIEALYKGNERDQFGTRLKNMGASFRQVLGSYDPRYWPIPADFTWDDGTKPYIDKMENDHPTTLPAFPERGNYFECYFQSPASEWHGMPRGAKHYTSWKRDPADSDPDAPAPAAPGPGGASSSFELLLDSTLAQMEPQMSEDPPPGIVIDKERQGFSDDMLTGFPYIRAKVNTHYDIDGGVVHLPLSRPRYSSATGLQTSVAISLHAGIARRTVTLMASRIGDYPVLPAPSAQSAANGFTEEFLRGDIVNHAPVVSNDGQNMVYTLESRWHYAMNRIPGPGDKLRVGADPRSRVTPIINLLDLTKVLDRTGKIDQA